MWVTVITTSTATFVINALTLYQHKKQTFIDVFGKFGSRCSQMARIMEITKINNINNTK